MQDLVVMELSMQGLFNLLQMKTGITQTHYYSRGLHKIQ